MGRRRKRISEAQLAQIETMAGLGLTLSKIAAILGMSERTLRRRRRELEAVERAIERGQALAEQTVATALYQQAIKGNVIAGIWLEKTRSGRTERTQIDVQELPRVVLVERFTEPATATAHLPDEPKALPSGGNGTSD